MIDIQGLSKKFNENKLFDNFSLTIDDGDFICISGDSGKGKTTLLNMIGHIEPYDSGKILIDGKEIQSNKELLTFFREEVGFVFQNYVLVEDKTIEQNLDLIRKPDRTGRSIEEVLSLLGLKEKQNSKVYTLSGGEQQRVAMARLYLKKCKYILADEPTGSLDRKNSDIIIKILEDLNKHGKTVIIVTHDDYIKNRVTRRVEL